MEIIEGIMLFIVVAIMSGIGIVVISNSIDNCDLINAQTVIIGESLNFIGETGVIGLNNPEGMARYGNQLYILEDNIGVNRIEFGSAEFTATRSAVTEYGDGFLMSWRVPGETPVNTLYGHDSTGAKAPDRNIVLADFPFEYAFIMGFDIYDDKIYVLVRKQLGTVDNNNVYVYSVSGNVGTPIPDESFSGIPGVSHAGLRIDQTNGEIYILPVSGGDEIFRYSLSGDQLTSLQMPIANRQIYDIVLDRTNNRIHMVDFSQDEKLTMNFQGESIPDENFDITTTNNPGGIMLIDEYFFIMNQNTSPVVAFPYDNNGIVSDGDSANFFRYDFANNNISNKIDLGQGKPLPDPRGLAAYDNHLLILEPSYNYLVQYDIVEDKVTDQTAIAFVGLENSGGVSATADEVFIVFNDGNIMRGDIDYIARTATNIISIGDADLTDAQGITVNGDKIYIIDGSTKGIYSYDYDGTTISNKKLEILTHDDPRGIASSGSSIYVVDSSTNHVDVYSFVDITESKSGWIDACEKNNLETQSTYALIPVIGILIAVVLTLLVLRKL